MSVTATVSVLPVSVAGSFLLRRRRTEAWDTSGQCREVIAQALRRWAPGVQRD
jgi:hypothetical protein